MSAATPLKERVAQLCNPYDGEEGANAVRLLAEEVGKLEQRAKCLQRAGDALCAAFDKEWLSQGDIESLQDDWDAANE